MAVLNIPCIRSSVLTWKGNEGVCEHSDIRIPLFNRIYDDACDAGFAVSSDKSNQVAIFAHYDDDMVGGEVVGSRFVCIGILSPNGRFIQRESALDVKILVIND